jgi:uncharacterized protein YukE
MTNTDLGGGAGATPSAGGTGASPKELASAAAQGVKQEVASFASTAQEKVADQVEQHKQAASQTLGEFANAIRKAGDELAQHDQSMAGRVVKQAANGLETLSRSVTDKRPEELLDAVRNFGRQNPGAFIAGSVLLGIALGRFAKSSQQDSQGGSGGRPSQVTGSDYDVETPSPYGQAGTTGQPFASGGEAGAPSDAYFSEAGGRINAPGAPSDGYSPPAGSES